MYSAASSYYQQQQQQQKQAAAAAAAAAATAAWTGTTFTKKAPFQNKQLKPKQPPKPPQIHYCDVCKISCAGPQVSVLCNIMLYTLVIISSAKKLTPLRIFVYFLIPNSVLLLKE